MIVLDKEVLHPFLKGLKEPSSTSNDLTTIGVIKDVTCLYRTF